MEQFLNLLAHYTLKFTHEILLVPLSILGYIWISKKAFKHAIFVIFISILLNYALKITFQIPLAPHLNKTGFAFPSGHMQASFVFYGWIFLQSKNTLSRILLGLLISCIAFSLIYLKYHTFTDIIGAATFGTLLLLWYSFISKQPYFLPIIFITSTILITYSHFKNQIPPHLWMAYFGIMGLSIAHQLFPSQNLTLSTQLKITNSILCFSLIALIYYTFYQLQPYFHSSTPRIILSQLQWGLIAFSIPFSNFIVSHLQHKSQKTLNL